MHYTLKEVTSFTDDHLAQGQIKPVKTFKIDLQIIITLLKNKLDFQYKSTLAVPGKYINIKAVLSIPT